MDQSLYASNEECYNSSAPVYYYSNNTSGYSNDYSHNYNDHSFTAPYYSYDYQYGYQNYDKSQSLQFSHNYTAQYTEKQIFGSPLTSSSNTSFKSPNINFNEQYHQQQHLNTVDDTCSLTFSSQQEPTFSSPHISSSNTSFCSPTSINFNSSLNTNELYQQQQLLTASVHDSSLSNCSFSEQSKRKSQKQAESKTRAKCHQLPEHAVDILNDWFDSHINHPYPTTEEKQKLADLCFITTKQVNSWFCNRRNRSQNTKPKRIQRQLEEQISNVYNELITNPNKTQVIERFRTTLIMHNVSI